MKANGIINVGENERSMIDRFGENILFKNNRDEVKLPFKEDQSIIEDNYQMSLKRLEHLKCKLNKNLEPMRKYDEIIQSQIKFGIVEKVDNSAEIGTVTYLPHHAVIPNNKKSTKVRVVFDTSAKNKGPSLNECLYKGSRLTPLLYDVLYII